jgi:DNA-binding transcriptional regulator YdaS (Cro superfamily)
MTEKYERVEAIDLAIERAGGILKFCKVMGVTHQAVYSWRKRGWVPPERAVVIEAIFKIDRNQLMNPDLLRAINTPVADLI